MITKVKLSQNGVKKDVVASFYKDSAFVLFSSVSLDFIPAVNDEIIDDAHHFLIKNITPLITGKSEFDNYALSVEKTI